MSLEALVLPWALVRCRGDQPARARDRHCTEHSSGGSDAVRGPRWVTGPRLVDCGERSDRGEGAVDCRVVLSGHWARPFVPSGPHLPTFQRVLQWRMSVWCSGCERGIGSIMRERSQAWSYSRMWVTRGSWASGSGEGKHPRGS